MVRKIEMERFSLTTSKRFDEVIAGVNAAIGHPDMAEFGRTTHEARSFAELKSAVEKGLSKVGLMLFIQLDHGAIVRKETGHETLIARMMEIHDVCDEANDVATASLLENWIDQTQRRVGSCSRRREQEQRPRIETRCQ